MTTAFRVPAPEPPAPGDDPARLLRDQRQEIAFLRAEVVRRDEMITELLRRLPPPPRPRDGILTRFWRWLA